WIASRNAQGERNLAPYSFFNCFNYDPPIIGFASTGWKDSVANIVETGEFVWNLTTRSLAAQMNQTSAALPRGTDEFEFAGLTPIAGNIVKADRIAQSPVSFECKLSQCIQLTAANGDKIDTWLVLGEVVAVHIEKHLLSAEGIYQTALAEPVLRAGGPSAYYGISDELRFDLHRPTL
ncbi:MAG TPA: Asp/Glu/hydantoin racemase, partial [Shewanella frigidimarina]|nr:Asp/Glu/hydantoin racemase [Shewanella frigidimarina]